MKLIIVITRDSDQDIVSDALVEKSYRVTCIASTGGFLHKGQSTLLIGTDDEKVDTALEIIRQNCTPSSEEDARHTILFVVGINQFIQF